MYAIHIHAPWGFLNFTSQLKRVPMAMNGLMISLWKKMPPFICLKFLVFYVSVTYY